MDENISSLESALFATAHRRLITVGQSESLDPYELQNFDFSIKLFLPDANAKWLIIFADPTNEDVLWGLADLGLGLVEQGPVSLRELKALRGSLGARVQLDILYDSDRAVKETFEDCRKNSRIIY